jgi:hypothetical protein
VRLAGCWRSGEREVVDAAAWDHRDFSRLEFERSPEAAGMGRVVVRDLERRLGRCGA